MRFNQQRQQRWSCLFMVFFCVLLFLDCIVGTEVTADDNTLQTGNASACGQKKTPGLCAGKYLRYAYNKMTGNCEAFYYSGCVSSANNFLTFEECRRDCMQKLRY